ncbi:MAG: hypothetical protein ABF254_04565 [Octadecabacter sp.]
MFFSSTLANIAAPWNALTGRARQSPAGIDAPRLTEPQGATTADHTSQADLLDRPLDIAQRATAAAQECWDIEARDVIYMPSNRDEFGGWRSVLQALDLTVLSGLNADIDAECDTPPLIILSAESWRTHRSSERLADLVLKCKPAVLCVLTGFVPPLSGDDDTPVFPSYRDARAILQAAGVGFFSIEEFGSV